MCSLSFELSEAAPKDNDTFNTIYANLYPCAAPLPPNSLLLYDLNPKSNIPIPYTMSHAEEDLIDYSDEELQTNDTATAAPAASNGAAKKGDLTVSGGNADKKGSYVGIHSTGFRDFLLKPELLRAITDCGFEHPSEGQS